MALAADLQRSALAQVAVSLCGKYTGKINMFVNWSEALSGTAGVPSGIGHHGRIILAVGDE